MSNEANFSMNFRATNEAGADIQLTVRGDTVSEFKAHRDELQVFMEENGMFDKTNTAPQAPPASNSPPKVDGNDNYDNWPAEDCKVVHAVTSNGKDAVKILNRTEKKDVYLFPGKASVLMATPSLDGWMDWPISEFVEGRGFEENVYSLPEEITAVIVDTSGQYAKVIALR